MVLLHLGFVWHIAAELSSLGSLGSPAGAQSRPPGLWTGSLWEDMQDFLESVENAGRLRPE